MRLYQIVLDTNVLVAGLRSKNGASHKLLRLLGCTKFQINISVPLLFEYEDVLKRPEQLIPLNENQIDSILDYLCMVANRHAIFFLWRPYLRDSHDDFILELAVESQSDYIVTFNKDDFRGIEQFGIAIVTPKEFLALIGELS